MKKAIAVFLAVAMTLGVVSCSKEPERKRKKDSGSKSKVTDTVDDDTEETLEDILETTERKKKKDKTEETEPLPEDVYCLDGKSPEELVEIAKYLADVKDNDTFTDIFKKLPVVPYGYDPDDLDKYDAYGIHFQWNYPLQDHAGIKEVIYQKNSYQYPDVKNIKLYENSYVEITFYFANEEACMAAEEAFYNYLSSLGELNTEKSTRREESSSALVSNLVFKSYPVTDGSAFADGNDCKIDKETYEMYFEPNYRIFVQNTKSIGCFLTVQIPIAGHIYQGGK